MKHLFFLLFFVLTTSIAIAQNTDKIIVTEQVAIKLATKKGYYQKDSSWLEPAVVLDTIAQQWIITSTKLMHVKRGKCYLKNTKAKDDCNCKNTNGCTDRITKQIKINALTGCIIEKSKNKERFPNYE
ncbi:MAG: hypothetical protein ABI315_13290 [Bacteroidia bacterium]